MYVSIHNLSGLLSILGFTSFSKFTYDGGGLIAKGNGVRGSSVTLLESLSCVCALLETDVALCF